MVEYEKRVLIITDSIYPNFTMNGIIADRIIGQLNNCKSIDILAYNLRKNDCKKYKGIDVHLVKSFPYYVYMFRDKSDIASRNKWFYKMCLLLVRSCSLMCRIISRDGINFVNVLRYKRSIIRLIKKNKYEVVLCTGVPFESFYAIEKTKKQLMRKNIWRKTKIYAYQLDDFVGNHDRFFPKILLNRRDAGRIIRLNRFVNAFDRYIMTEAVYKKEKRWINCQDKVIETGLPLLINTNRLETKRITAKKNEMNKGIKFVYAGSLVKGLRQPTDTLRFLTLLAKEVKMEVEVFHRGDCGSIIREYERMTNGSIKDMGMVNSEVAYTKINEADVLVSIGTFDGDQISGKTFEYLSTGKLILYFFYNEKDMNLPFIENYELGLPVKLQAGCDPSNDTIRKTISFIEEKQGQTVPVKKIMQNYYQYTPDGVTEAIFGK